jgi:hypothetical protein
MRPGRIENMKTAFRRILKYAPAVVMWLLVIGWVVSCFRSVGVVVTFPNKWEMIFFVSCGNAGLVYEFPRYPSDSLFLVHSRFWDLSLWRLLGSPQLIWSPQGGKLYLIQVPFAALLTAGLPFTIGPVLSFRFRLWHYLAYTALVAVELAYYLRWQA